METEHDNLQTVAAVGAFEEAWAQQVRGHCRRQVDPPVCQAVTVKTKQIQIQSDFCYYLTVGLQKYVAPYSFQCLARAEFN